jgi:hypothetical protein
MMNDPLIVHLLVGAQIDVGQSQGAATRERLSLSGLAILVTRPRWRSDSNA